MSPPSVLFEQPLCAEVMGAGFQKLSFSHYFELRWPRLQKIFPPDERTWTEGKFTHQTNDANKSSDWI
jgi:DNA ligase-4